ncbi:MAG: hypothetical protein C0401_12770, partial [Anaerolinea sp.]|nr:hypothetical protein [Anaerolinea sp.]
LLLFRQPGGLLRQRLDRQPLLALDVRLQEPAVVTRLGQQRHRFGESAAIPQREHIRSQVEMGVDSVIALEAFV